MTLPQHFDSYEAYFVKCTEFFEEYQQLYNFANTELLVKGVLDGLRFDDLDGMDVYKDDFDIRSEMRADAFVDGFFNKLDKLRAKYYFVEAENVGRASDAPLGPKKRHEIVYLANEIGNLCDEVGCDTVVDFGSGLGYLDQIIYDRKKFNVLGLECNEKRYARAKIRQNKYHVDSTSCVKFMKHTITELSHINIDGFLDDKFPNCEGFCITGLHACADLTVDAINIFLKMPKAKSMVLMPCCYHKMRLDNMSDGRFANFPLSNCFKEVYYKNRGFEYMRIPFLRLAAQPHYTCQSNMKNLVFNLLARAVLELYAHEHNYKIKRRKRKAVKVKTVENNFESYAHDACTEGFSFINCNDNSLGLKETTKRNQGIELLYPSNIFEELKSVWQQLSPMTFKKAAIFISLQNYLQPVIENFILLDRIVYLRESGLLNTTCKRIVNDKISPRCLALFAHK